MKSKINHSNEIQLNFNFMFFFCNETMMKSQCKILQHEKREFVEGRALTHYDLTTMMKRMTMTMVVVGVEVVVVLCIEIMLGYERWLP